MAVPLETPVTGCADCKRLHWHATSARGDFADTRKKLIKAQRGGHEARYVDEAKERKARVTNTQENYWAHRAEAHPRANAAAFSNLGSKYQAEPADLPRASDMAAMLEDGWTRQGIADKYGCSVSTVNYRLSTSGYAAKQPEPEPEPVDVLNLWDAAWLKEGLCAQTDPEAFFPAQGGSPRPAKAVCASCEVRTECLEAALEAHIVGGVWGGKTYRERRRILKERQQQGDVTGLAS